MPVQVIFSYDAGAAKWVCTVRNASDTTEAMQAFHAVALTCQMLEPALFDHTQVAFLDGEFVITPAVRAPEPRLVVVEGPIDLESLPELKIKGYND